nr:hypothetical protein [Tanacetum cinerariifolium]
MAKVNAIDEEATRTWMTPIQEYIEHGILPEDAAEAQTIQEKARNYTIEEGVLYQKSYLRPLLRCVGTFGQACIGMPTIKYQATTHGIELEAYGIKYASRSMIKGKLLADFLADTMVEDSPTKIKASGSNDTLAEGKSMEEQEAPEAKALKKLWTEADLWKLYTDRASNEHRSRAGLILIDPKGAEYSYALRLNIANSNNDVEYEALLEGLRIAAKTKVEKMHAFVDSKLVAS